MAVIPSFIDKYGDDRQGDLSQPLRILRRQAYEKPWANGASHRFPSARYTVGKSVEHPDAILVRSHDMHSMAIPASAKAIGRAGAGTNNIQVAEMSRRGVPVFNASGANAHAVKELVFAAMLMAARTVVPTLAGSREARAGVRKQRLARLYSIRSSLSGSVLRRSSAYRRTNQGRKVARKLLTLVGAADVHGRIHVESQLFHWTTF